MQARKTNGKSTTEASMHFETLRGLSLTSLSSLVMASSSSAAPGAGEVSKNKCPPDAVYPDSSLDSSLDSQNAANDAGVVEAADEAENDENTLLPGLNDPGPALVTSNEAVTPVLQNPPQVASQVSEAAAPTSNLEKAVVEVAAQTSDLEKAVVEVSAQTSGLEKAVVDATVQTDPITDNADHRSALSPVLEPLQLMSCVPVMPCRMLNAFWSDITFQVCAR